MVNEMEVISLFAICKCNSDHPENLIVNYGKAK